MLHNRIKEDLPQGGLEIPVFKGNAKDTAKANELIKDALNLRKSDDLSIPDSATGIEVVFGRKLIVCTI